MTNEEAVKETKKWQGLYASPNWFDYKDGNIVIQNTAPKTYCLLKDDPAPLIAALKHLRANGFNEIKRYNPPPAKRLLKKIEEVLAVTLLNGREEGKGN